MAESFPRSIRVLGIVVCWLGVTAPMLWADPIVVTSGRFDIGRGPANAGTFTFFGSDGFLLSAFDVSTAAPFSPSCPPTGCRPGDSLNLSLVAGTGSGVTAGLPLPAAFTLGSAFSAVVNGTTFAPPVDFPRTFPGPLGLAGTLRFDAPPIVVSDAATFARSPFILSGHVAGFNIDDVDARHPLFDVDLAGQGTALIDFEDGGVMHLVFAATPAPTPEPATLLLLGTALCGLAARARSKGERLRSAAIGEAQ